ncbi:MAG TPA: flagellar motor protein MotB [Sedimentisphaerales bacterium]|nr:flagellar motor protein MotB [Sedimentisphaerales bacterium]
MSRVQKPADEGPQVPVWIITFSDMITLLLTFFVLIVSMGKVRDDTLFDQGRALFMLQSIKTGFGFREAMDLGNPKIKYYMENPEVTEGRTIDDEEEGRRRIFNKLSQTIRTLFSQAPAEKANFTIADISFASGRTALDEPAKKYLAQFSLDIQNNLNPETDTLYIQGLAGEPAGGGEQQQWILSAKRARAVADFLQKTLAPTTENQIRPQADSLSSNRPQWRIFWWGAGPGGDWVKGDRTISENLHILIAVVRKG